MKANYILLILLFMMVYSTTCHASWLIYYKPEYHGRVIDIDTGQPIEGAVVVAKYQKETLAPPVEPKSSVIHVKETLTDKDGRFTFPSYTTIIQPFSWSYDVSFLIFKPGYLCYGWSVLEDMFSGKDNTVVERNPIWNKRLTYRFDILGTILLPKVISYEDRFQSALKFSTPIDYDKYLPISKKVNQGEIDYLNLIRGK
ncbi:carboxypeptidase-like regulatory domain-containing protein [Geobacter sp. AOG1]|uniref:carboxypeptidase-like regulatory domain-containing protein n=1 Tax=Geobacter sp. AOG1 TaxID=1566346 RepID=UPI001CC757F0|nr:carboxypeptidase-like regulatory domain-containing protein [Geobacter sp. AOG1]GFE59365.1 hypothetical protein AOG1_32450 [Geobacter sp. AOG1]